MLLETPVRAALYSPIYSPLLGKYGGGPAYDPASLFANGEKGVWFDPSDLSTMFQDADGAVPVTAHGDPVRRINDKSGNGYHWIAPSDAARPVYQTDGTYHWLDFNGSTHALSVAISSMGVQMDIVAALRPNSGETTWLPSYANTSYWVGAAEASSTGDTYAPKTISPAMPWIDGVAAVSNTRGGVQSSVGVATSRLMEVRCSDLSAWPAFAFGAFGSGFQFAGRLYGLILVPYLSYPTRLKTQDWLAAKAGVSLASRAQHPVIAVLGDSTIAPYNNTREVTSYIDGIDDLVFAVPGQSIAQQRARWNAMSDRSQFDSVVIQVGLNDLDPGESATTALAGLQSFVNDALALRPPSCPILLGSMTPCRARLIALYGGTNGPIAYQKWLDMNDAIAGNGPNSITGVDGRITAHVALLDDGSGNLAAEYDTGDGIHENNAGRQIIAAAWEDALAAVGVL